MRIRRIKSAVTASLFLGLLLFPAASRAEEKTGDKTGLKIEQKSGQKIDENADLKDEVQPEPKIEEKSIPKTEVKPVLKNAGGSPLKIEDKPNSITEGKAAPKADTQPEKKSESPFAFGKRWDTDTYVDLNVVLDRYWGVFNQVVKGEPIGARFRRGGDWKYAAFHYELSGGYCDSLKSSTATITEGKLGFVNMSIRLNGVLPVLYGVMLQGGIMNETWAEFSEYETASRKENNIYVVDGLGPDLMLSFTPVKYVSLNFEYSAILKPLISKHYFGSSSLSEDVNINGFKVSDSSFSTIEVGISARPLKYVSLSLTYGEKKSSHQATYKNNNHPENNKAARFKNLNDYILIGLNFTY